MLLVGLTVAWLAITITILVHARPLRPLTPGGLCVASLCFAYLLPMRVREEQHHNGRNRAHRSGHINGSWTLRSVVRGLSSVFCGGTRGAEAWP